MRTANYHYLACAAAAAAAIMLPSPTSANDIRLSVNDMITCHGTHIKTSNVVGICETTDHDEFSSDKCIGGDTVEVTGDMSIKSPGFSSDENPEVYLTPCLYLRGPFGSGFTFNCMDEYKQQAGNLCDWYNYESRGASCGDVGNFQFDYNVTLPSEANDIDFNDYGFPVDIIVKTSLGSMCVVESGDDDATVAYGAVGVVLLVGAVGLFQRRRRRVATESSEDDKAEAFVEMTDTSETVV